MALNDHFLLNAMMGISRSKILIILTCAVLVRVCVALGASTLGNAFTPYHEHDTISYYNPARSLVETGRFYRNAETPEIFRTPGYPLLMVPGIVSGHVELVTIALQLVLSCLTVLAVFGISNALFANERSALVASFLFAFDPLSVVYTNSLMSETLFTFLFTIAILCLLKYGEHSVIFLAVSSLAFACATYVRPVGHYAAWTIFGILMFWACFRSQRAWRMIGHACIFLLLYTAATIPWQLRNWSNAGYWGFSPVGEFNLYCVFRPAMEKRSGSGVGLDHPDESRPCEKCCRNLDSCLNELEKFPYVVACMKSGVAEALVKNFKQGCQVAVEGFMRFWLSPGASKVLHLFGLDCPEDVYQQKERKSFIGKRLMYLREWPAYFFLDLFLGVWLWACEILAISSVFSFKLYRRIGGILVIGTVLYVAIGAGLSLGTARLRHPVMPLLYVLAGAQLERLISKRFPNRSA